MRFYLIILALGCALGLAVGAWAATPADEAYTTAKQLLDTGNDQQAVTAFKKFVETYDNDSRVHDANYLMGCGYVNLQQYPPALAAFAKVIEKAIAPDLSSLRAKAYFQTGDCQARLQEFQKAVDAYAACLKLAGKDADLQAQAQYWMADALTQLDRTEDALAAYAKVLKIDAVHPLASWSLYAQGSLKSRTQDYAGAITLFGQLLKNYPESPATPPTKVSLGTAYASRARSAVDETARTNDLQKATTLLTSVQDDPQIDKALRRQATLSLAQVYVAMKDFAKADAAFTAALAGVDAESEQALQIRMMQANTNFNAERYLEAATSYESVVNSKNAGTLAQEALYWLANCRYQQALLAKDRATYQAATDLLQRFITNADQKEPRLPRATLLTAFCFEDQQKLGDTEAGAKAIDSYVNLLKNWPKSAEASEVLNGIIRLTADMKTAELAKLVSTLPTGTVSWTVQLQLIRTYETGEAWEESATAAQTLLKAKPTDDFIAQADYLLGVAYLHLERAKDAIPVFEQALTLAKSDEMLVYLRQGVTKAYNEVKQSDKAVENAKVLVTLPVLAKDAAGKELEMAERWDLLARALADSGQYASAIDAYRHIITECPTSPLLPAALLGSGWLAEQAKDPAKAETFYRQVMAKYAGQDAAFDAALRLAPLLSEKKSYQEIIDLLEKIPDTAKRADEAAYAVAWAYSSLGNDEEAGTRFAKFAEQYPKSPLAGDCLFRLGESHFANKRFADARKSFTSALALLPAGSALIPAAQYKLGACAFSTGGYAEAAKAFDAVVTQFADSDYAADCLYWKGMALEQQGKAFAADARASYQQYIKKYPQGVCVLDAALGAGRAALLAGLADARKDLQLAIDLAKRENLTAELSERAKNILPEAYYYLGQVLVSGKQYDDAISAYAVIAAYNLEPWYSRSLLEMARSSALKGDKTAAAQTIKLLQQKCPASDAAKQAREMAEELGIQLK